MTNIPAPRRPGRPYKTLSSAVARSASECDVLLLLRKRLAAQLDGDDMPPAAFGALVRQFRQIDQQLRALEAAAAAAADVADGPDDDLDDEEAGGWDPSKL
ncbi:hypothetical protein [Mycobacterium sp.]|uniref:hypothetical protein n=1 Tax=Mycobacterium sp. TaxID=1785 RepID=UPI003F944D20